MRLSFGLVVALCAACACFAETTSFDSAAPGAALSDSVTYFDNFQFEGK